MSAERTVLPNYNWQLGFTRPRRFVAPGAIDEEARRIGGEWGLPALPEGGRGEAPARDRNGLYLAKRLCCTTAWSCDLIVFMRVVWVVSAARSLNRTRPGREEGYTCRTRDGGNVVVIRAARRRGGRTDRRQADSRPAGVPGRHPAVRREVGAQGRQGATEQMPPPTQSGGRHRRPDPSSRLLSTIRPARDPELLSTETGKRLGLERGHAEASLVESTAGKVVKRAYRSDRSTGRRDPDRRQGSLRDN